MLLILTAALITAVIIIIPTKLIDKLCLLPTDLDKNIIKLPMICVRYLKNSTVYLKKSLNYKFPI